MRYSKQLKRREEIEQSALELIMVEGYHSTSMLRVAKRAQCSNETLYRWYGGKAKFLSALVERNRAALDEELCQIAQRDLDDLKGLEDMGAVILEHMLGPEAIALLRAVLVEQDTMSAQGENHNAMNVLIGKPIKNRLEGQLMLAISRGGGTAPDKTGAVDTYLSLLFGDLLLRNALGCGVALTKKQCRAQSRMALEKSEIANHFGLRVDNIQSQLIR